MLTAGVLIITTHICYAILQHLLCLVEFLCLHLDLCPSLTPLLKLLLAYNYKSTHFPHHFLPKEVYELALMCMRCEMNVVITVCILLTLRGRMLWDTDVLSW